MLLVTVVTVVHDVTLFLFTKFKINGKENRNEKENIKSTIFDSDNHLF